MILVSIVLVLGYVLCGAVIGRLTVKRSWRLVRSQAWADSYLQTHSGIGYYFKGGPKHATDEDRRFAVLWRFYMMVVLWPLYMPLISVAAFFSYVNRADFIDKADPEYRDRQRAINMSYVQQLERDNLPMRILGDDVHHHL